MRASKQIGLLRHSSTGTDAHGNETDDWSPAVTLDVYGWGPAYGSIETGNSRVVVGIDVFMPSDYGVSALDRVVLDDVTYEVDGEVADYSNGPFSYRAGCVIRLKRVDR
jgi:hypothetical protein